MPSLGEEFRAAREARNLSVSDVSARIHIRSVYLQSLEDEEWTAIAAPVYVRGFIRTYARFLGIDPEHAVATYNAAVGELPGAYIPPPLREFAPRRRPSPWLWLLGAVAVALIVLVAYDYFQFQTGGAGGVNDSALATSSPAMAGSPVEAATPAAGGSPAAHPSAVVVEPLGGSSAVPAPSASGGGTPTTAAATRQAHTLVISTIAPTWVRIVVDGNAQVLGILQPGTHRTYHGNKVTLRVGNAGGIEVSVDGRSIGKLGTSGEVVERSFAL